jgi:hypothetical protein
MEYKFTDFMKSLTGKLDSIHGNRGNVPEDSYYLYEMDLKADATELEKAEHIAKEKLWLVDKGESFVYDFMRGHNGEDLGNGNERYDFEQEVRFYCLRGLGIYMNVRRIVLPPKKTVEVGKTKRLYVLRDGREFWKTPSLLFPSSPKDLLKWLRKKKKIKLGKDTEIWNHNETLDKWRISYTPMKNIKSEEDLSDYNGWIETEYRDWIVNVYNKNWTRIEFQGKPERAVKINPILLEIKQEDIDQFVIDYNNRFKIER